MRWYVIVINAEMLVDRFMDKYNHKNKEPKEFKEYGKLYFTALKQFYILI